MSDILTLETEANNRCMAEVNAVLRKYGRALNPKVVMTISGMQFSVDVVAAQLAGPTKGEGIGGGIKDA